MDAIPPFVFLILIVALLAMAAGLVVWLFGYIRDGDTRNSKSSQPGTSGPSQTTTIEGDPAILVGTQEMLSVRLEENGELAVFVQGRRYRHLHEIEDRQAGREAVQAIKCVMTFAEGWLPAPREESPQPVPVKPVVDQSAQHALDGEAFLEQLRQSDLFPLEKKPPGMLDGLVRRRARRSLDPLLTPADAINDIIQRRLEGRPDLVRHNIRLTTGQDGGLRFHVGLQTFTVAEDISEPEIRGFVQDAIQEWREG
jgi:hypothetical protein